MTKRDIANSFRNFVKGRGVNFNHFSPFELPDLFIAYYTEVQFDEIAGEENGDLVLFQYGIFDWGDGRYFELDFTRQLTQTFPNDVDHQMYQQHVTFYYDPAHFEEIKTLNLWSLDIVDMNEFKIPLNPHAASYWL